MAWSAPKTWVDQETPSAEDFNTQIRDNLNALSTHTHTGAAGDGSATLNSVDYIDLDEGGSLSTPASGHTRFAANNDGTLRYFAQGSTEKTVSDTTHSHTQASGASNTNTQTGTTALGTSYSGSSKGCSITVTPSDSTGSSQYVQVITAAALFQNANGYSGTVYQNIEKDGSELVEFSASMPAPINSEVQIIGTYVEIAAAASSSVYQTDFKKAGDMNGNVHDTYEAIREVRCL
tara:strand:- start:53 stop:754 length:702 start_codon:yes stop_codon:yes gene_type:complete